MSLRALVVGLTVPVTLLLSSACAPHEETDQPKPQTVEPQVDPKPEPDPEPKPEPEPEPDPVVATAVISSIYLMDDCPGSDPKPKAKSQLESGASRPEKSQPKPAEGARADMGAMGDVADDSLLTGARRGCSQSTMQVSFTGQGDAPGQVRVESVKLLSSDGKELETLESRAPTLWNDNGYELWDRTIPAKADVKVSYRLSAPDWNAVGEGPMGGGTYRVLVTFDIEGHKQTVRSPEFTREMPHDIVT